MNTFQSPNTDPIGSVHAGEVNFSSQPLRKHTVDTPFDISDMESLPRVDIVYQAAGLSGPMLKAIIDSKPAGIVIAGVGDGGMSAQTRAKLRYAAERGIVVVRSSRVGSGRVTPKADDYPGKDSTIPADILSPQQARQLLMLSLAHEQAKADIKLNFTKLF